MIFVRNTCFMFMLNYYAQKVKTQIHDMDQPKCIGILVPSIHINNTKYFLHIMITKYAVCLF
jgi:hypothetical protein